MSEVPNGFGHRYRDTFRLSAICRDERGAEYVKSVEISPEGIYKAERLTDAIEHYCLELRKSCNQNHLVASGTAAGSSTFTCRPAAGRSCFMAMTQKQRNEETVLNQAKAQEESCDSGSGREHAKPWLS